MSEQNGMDKYYVDVLKDNIQIYVSEYFQIVLFIVLLQALFYYQVGTSVGQRKKADELSEVWLKE